MSLDGPVYGATLGPPAVSPDASLPSFVVFDTAAGAVLESMDTAVFAAALTEETTGRFTRVANLGIVPIHTTAVAARMATMLNVMVLEILWTRARCEML